MATEFRDENVTVGSFNPNCTVFRSTQPHDATLNLSLSSKFKIVVYDACTALGFVTA